ncbi:MAG: biotin--[acetyl-CoA-carboxylase] ligase [Betaproteobacteria bacterium]|nr:biotin--[acetyl-CoA-carboxylase] ligase [Betaproteobacteria bacterium]
MDRLSAAAIRVPGVEVRVLGRCASTNAALLAGRLTQPVLLAADEQTAGRGRRSRRWHSEPGCGALFSLGLPLRRPARDLGGLSIVAGVAAVRALRALGARDVALKWPNDLLARGAKLGGILVETRAQGAGSAAVIGVGVNHRDAHRLAARLRREVAALEDILQPLPERNAVIGALARGLLAALRAFDADGFGAFREDWEALHAHAGKRLRVRLADGRRLAGIAAGLADDGALQLRTRYGVRTVRNGSVTRARPA